MRGTRSVILNDGGRSVTRDPSPLTLDTGHWTLDFGSDRQPRRQILLRALLSLKPFRDYDEGTIGKQVPQHGGDKRLSSGTDAGAGQYAPLLQAPCQGLHGGSYRDSSE